MIKTTAGRYLEGTFMGGSLRVWVYIYCYFFCPLG
jgi:hypothetical protein